MDFRTRVPIENGKEKIDHSSRILMLGSCFSENIAAKFDWFRYPFQLNPFGIIFHPSPLAEVVQRIANRKYLTKEDVFQHEEQAKSLYAHSRLNKKSTSEYLQNAKLVIDSAYEFLKTASHVIVTLGTAWGYRDKKLDRVVANCHKLPQQQFKKELSEIHVIEIDLNSIVSSILKVNPQCSIIFTVSPVRHLKDGMIENQISKAHLIAALAKVKNLQNVDYFPSYEIMMDELRDYRFYADDMIHPNSTAINYIWKQFSENWITEKSLALHDQIEKVQKGLNHRKRAESVTSDKKILTKIQDKIAQIQKICPEINFPEVL